MLAQFRDYLKTLDVATHYSIGKIDNSKEKSLGVYSTPYLARIEAVGKASSYDVAGVVILLHWNKNAKETEEASKNLYEKIRYITDTDMSDVHVEYVNLREGTPVSVGTDDNGVYEYTISADIYYRRD